MRQLVHPERLLEPRGLTGDGSRRPASAAAGEQGEGFESRLLSLLRDRRTRLHIVGLGNPMRGDDAVGLEIVSGLLRAIAKRRSGNVSIHRPTATPERELGRFDLSKERLLIFDAVGFGGVPGQFFLSSLDESQYGFFATHNVPLRLIPGLAANPSRVFVCGIEPAELGVDEGISEAVRSSAEKVTSLVLRELGGGKDGYH